MIPGGTVIWTAPTGRTYKTLPGSRIFFPAFNTTTAQLPTRQVPTPGSAKALMMPKRRRTRAADRADRIREERKLNAADAAQWARQAAQAAQRNKPPPTEECDLWEIATNTETDDGDPPPF